MKNGTRSNRLTLVDGAGQEITDSSDVIDPVVDADVGDAQRPQPPIVSPILILFTVSIACATAAIAAGSYGLWLSRQKAARQTLTDVQDILRLCQERMRKMDAELDQLPQSLAETAG